MFQNLARVFTEAQLLVLSTTASGKSGWSLDSFFSNVVQAIQTYGGWILIIVGTASLIWSIVQAFRKYVFQSQEVRVGPVTLIAGAVFGAAFMLGGWTLANSIGQGLKETADEFGGQGGGVAMLVEYLKYLWLK